MAPSLGGRIELHRTSYHEIPYQWGRCWITIDKIQVWSSADDPWDKALRSLTDEIEAIYQTGGDQNRREHPEQYRASDDAKEILLSQGIISTFDFDDLLKSYLSLSIDDALDEKSPLLRAIALTDVRVGKRRLRALAGKNAREHELVKLLYRTRGDAEGIRVISPDLIAPKSTAERTVS